MIKVGLTGNIGTGKSTVARIFEILGIPVYHADEEAKKFLEDQHVIQNLKSEFGKSIIIDQKVDRIALAKIVFNDQNALDFLNNLIHPLVRNDLYEWLEKQSHQTYIIQEAAILFESGFYKEFDKVITIIAPEELSISRVMKRDNVTSDQIKSRIRNQWSQERKMELSDFIINNDELQLVIPQVLQIHNSFIQ